MEANIISVSTSTQAQTLNLIANEVKTINIGQFASRALLYGGEEDMFIEIGSNPEITEGSYKLVAHAIADVAIQPTDILAARTLTGNGVLTICY